MIDIHFLLILDFDSEAGRKEMDEGEFDEDMLNELDEGSVFSSLFYRESSSLLMTQLTLYILVM